MTSPIKEGKGHLKSLVAIFAAWKLLLLALAALCPGPGYDTSALILVDTSTARHQNFTKFSPFDRLTLNLFRWDALYTVKAAERGKLHEQEWAFSWAYSQVLGLVGQLGSNVGGDFSLRPYIVAGILISNICHLLSVVVLYQLLAITTGSPQRHQIAFVGAVLHITTSASLFLSAPYTEAPFALFNLTGMLLYAQARLGAPAHKSSVVEDVCKLGSGIFFALATLMRSNGLLSGLVLLYDVARYIPRIISMQLAVHDVRRILITCAAGSIIALGFVYPQYLAFTEFCPDTRATDAPEWCARSIPSIYSWVQSHYWNVGLFRYWTAPNLPLFMIAAPMLWLLVSSSVMVLSSYLQPPLHGRPVPQASVTTMSEFGSAAVHYVPELALPQLVLAVAAFSSFHVQIINRLASGYPTWYWMVAAWIVVEQKTPRSSNVARRNQWIVRGTFIYALAQGMLFANFLPPA
ncbi:GPI mannosyltransferase 2 [Phaeosphaeria sp. MPI-PUGE-AT-0046c]|nr:GPI mannosyltransferase 2 [Phaeosphaeria sp. MPI-PUGE-AT-0046c]